MGRSIALKRRLLSGCPHCIYCGGETLADTVDHMPPAIIFLGKDRPKGMEFASCLACNQGGSHSEQAAALFSRLHPGPETVEAKKELGAIILALHNNQPGLLAELHRGPEFKPVALEKIERGHEDLIAVEIDGPFTRAALNMFSAKLAFALHYENTKTPVSLKGGVYIRWHTNLDALEGRIPQDMIAILGSRKTLQQGAKTAWDQFGFRSVTTPDGASTGHYAHFRQSFSVSAIATTDLSLWKFDVEAGSRGVFFRPGFLRAAA